MDHRALKILIDRHWTSMGWRRELTTPQADFEYAVEAGYMFHDVALSHDEIVARLLQARDKANLEEIVECFQASLGSRRLELRSALGSYAYAKNFPDHSWMGQRHFCEVCGIWVQPTERQDLNVLNFERYKWGGVRHDEPLYAAFDLEQFQRTGKLSAQQEDKETFTGILDVVRGLDRDARPRTVERATSRLLRSNKSEREILIQILGYCGILESESHPGYFSGYTNYVDRTLPPASKIDWTYPVCWWRASDGIKSTALRFYFSI